jgi:CRISPR/Cas system CMR subunit Cmr4 (Cas7 group RAMP superfamily)
MGIRTDRIQITYDLVFATPFHCGTGIREALIDRTIVADNNGYLYVPATTFKGVLREHCEQLALLYANKSKEQTDRIKGPHDKQAALYDLGGTISMITRIFGSPICPGTLYFDDARQDEEYRKLYDSGSNQDDLRRYLDIQKDVYTQVRLDRPTRTAVEGALYTSEFGARGLTFQGSITGTLTCFPIDAKDTDKRKPTYSLLLLLAGLRFIERMGGNKSSGKGQCECKIKVVEVEDSEVSWQHWFADLSQLSNYAVAALEEETA